MSIWCNIHRQHIPIAGIFYSSIYDQLLPRLNCLRTQYLLTIENEKPSQINMEMFIVYM